MKQQEHHNKRMKKLTFQKRCLQISISYIAQDISGPDRFLFNLDRSRFSFACQSWRPVLTIFYFLYIQNHSKVCLIFPCFITSHCSPSIGWFHVSTSTSAVGTSRMCLPNDFSWICLISTDYQIHPNSFSTIWFHLQSTAHVFVPVGVLPWRSTRPHLASCNSVLRDTA